MQKADGYRGRNCDARPRGPNQKPSDKGALALLKHGDAVSPQASLQSRCQVDAAALRL